MSYFKNIENRRELYQSHLCIKHHDEKDIFILPNGFSSPFCLKRKITIRDSAKYLPPCLLPSLPPSLEIIRPTWLRWVSLMFYTFTIPMFLPPANYVSVSWYKYRSCILITIEYSNNVEKKWVYSWLRCRPVWLFPFVVFLFLLFVGLFYYHRCFCNEYYCNKLFCACEAFL